MFNLAVIDDTIKLEACQLGSDTVSALTYNINAKYSNRILPNVGLCISHFDFSSISEGHLKNGDGCTYYKATFRLIVFRPFKGEILVGKVKSCDEDGVRITLGFFDDIYVSRDALPMPSGYDHTEAAWFWVGNPDDDSVYDDALLSAKEQRFYFDKNEPVRFLVDGDEYNEPEPPGPSTWGKNALKTGTGQGGADIKDVESATRVAPYKVKVSERNGMAHFSLRSASPLVH